MDISRTRIPGLFETPGKRRNGGNDSIDNIYTKTILFEGPPTHTHTHLVGGFNEIPPGPPPTPPHIHILGDKEKRIPR